MATALATSSMRLAGVPAARSQRAVIAAAPRSLRQRRRAAVITAAAEDPERASLAQFARGAERVLARYDFVSAGLGALVVTGFCVSRGQDVGTALWITAAATVVGLLVNDAIPE